jgi:aminoglycoside 3-N-acetyltransferase
VARAVVTVLSRLSDLAEHGLDREKLLALRRRYFELRARLHPLLRAVRGSFTTDDLRRHLDERVGHRFEILMVHSSMNYMQPYHQGGALELLNMLVDYVGPERTLAMPAFYFGDVQLNDVVEHYRRAPRFDVRRTPSQMGILTELFRRRAGVKLSVHPSHRVAALGPLAEELTAGHVSAGTPCGKGTPFDVMALHDTAIIGIGKSSEVVTQAHHAEDLLGDAFPEPSVVTPVDVTVTDGAGRELVFALHWRTFQRPRKMQRLRKLMAPDHLREWTFHGVPMFYTRAAWVTEDLLAAARQGRTLHGAD